MRSIVQKSWPFLLLLALILLVFREAFLPPTPAWVLSRPEGDVATLYYYWRAFGFGELKNGDLPLWNPYIFCGSPFAAYPESALFYPLNAVFLVLTVSIALNASFILHLFLLALFQYLYLRKIDLDRWCALLGAVVLSLSAPVILHLHAGHLSNICSLAWVPLVFWAAEGFLRSRRLRWAVGGGTFCGLMLLAGHAQYVFYTGIFAGLYLLIGLIGDFRSWREHLLQWLAGVVLFVLFAAGVSAVQIAPAWEISRESFRQVAGYSWAANFSFPPLNLLTFFLPDAFGDGVKSFYYGRYYFWEMCGYLGVVALFLAIGGVFLRRDKLTLRLALGVLVAILLAFGGYTPLFRFLYEHVPGFDLFRGSAKLLFFAAFFLSGLTARGAAAAASVPRERKLGLLVMSGILVSLFLAVLLFLAAAPSGFFSAPSDDPPAWWKRWLQVELLRGRHYDIVVPGQPSWWRELMQETPPEREYARYVARLVNETPFAFGSWGMFRASLFRFAGLALGTAAIVAAGSIAGASRFLPPAFLLISLLELVPWARRFIVGFDSRVCRWPPPEAEFFRDQTEAYRYLSFDPGDFNRGMLAGFPCLLGYQADASFRFLEYINFSQGKELEPEELLPLVERFSPLLDLLNLKYMIAPAGMVRDEAGWRRVFSGGGREIWFNPRAGSRILISPRARTVRDRAQILRELNRPGYDPEEFIIVETEVTKTAAEGREGKGRARLAREDDRSITVEAELASPGYLLVNDSWAPGWEAFADGVKTPIYRANYLMRAVFLTAGRHTVVFRYRPLSFRIGAAVSLATVIAVVVMLAVSLRRGKFGKLENWKA